MALWGNSANITRKTAGIVTCNYSTLEVVGSGTSFGLTDANGVGYAKTGQVIRFGVRGGAGGADDFFGDAVITGVTSDRVLSIGSTAGLSGVAIAGTDFTVTQQPVYTVLDSSQSENSGVGVADQLTYGVAAANLTNTATSKYEVAHGGWVGVTTYVDQHGELRVKKETLVAMSGITTGNVPVYDTNPTV